MTGCPFGFSGGGGEDDGAVEGMDPTDVDQMTAMLGQALDDEDDPLTFRTAAGAATPKKRKGKKKSAPTPDVEDDLADDPLSWFAKHQIKNEADFDSKRDILRAEARKRLDALNAGRKQMRDLEGSEFGSLFSSNMSDLDSDGGSLSTLKSCAQQWVEAVCYSSPAENTFKCLAVSCCAVSVCAGFQAISSKRLIGTVVGIVLHTWWPSLTLGVVGMLLCSALMAYGAAAMRSKRFLLTSLAGFIITYASALALVVALSFQPTVVDERLQSTACKQRAQADAVSRLCGMIPGVTRNLEGSTQSLLYSCVAMLLTGLAMWGVGIWYTFELAYMEKKGLKLKRRQRRQEHSIPWDKIRVIDWASTAAEAEAPKGLDKSLAASEPGVVSNGAAVAEGGSDAVAGRKANKKARRKNARGTTVCDASGTTVCDA